MVAARLFDGVAYDLMNGGLDAEVLDIVDDSRTVTDGAVFVCRRGTVTDGHNYIDDAMIRGAVGIVITEEYAVETSGTGPVGSVKPFIVRIHDYRKSIGIICNNFWGAPSRQMTMVAVTGTKGKTTVAYMIKHMLDVSGRRCGLVGTIEIDDGETSARSVNTTPGIIYLHRKLADMVDHGLKYCVMEVSSQGMMHGRVSGVDFDVGVFTNLSPDHMGKGEHSTFEEYARWKRALVGRCRLAVINAGDVYAGCFEQSAVEADIPIVYYGIGKEMKHCFPDKKKVYMAGDIQMQEDDRVMGTRFELYTPNDGLLSISVGIPGEFNVCNAVAAIAVGNVLGIPYDVSVRSLGDVSISGRLESVMVSQDIRVVIDYAHNPISLRNVLSALEKYRHRRIICVFGCGGNRSLGRRYGMGLVSGVMADMTVITSDNPRWENPEDIMTDIEKGVKDSGCAMYVKIPDRKKAIEFALDSAEKGDMILLAGKGHETYQEICGQKIHMDERELIRQILEEDNERNIRGCDN